MTLEVRTATTTLELRDDGRTLVGLAVPYNVETRIGSYVESFAPGAFDGTDPATVPVLAAHNRTELPIGRALSLTDTPAGLAVELRISQTAYGDDVLALVRDGAATGLSIGFQPVEGGDRWNRDRTKVTRTRANLVEISVVGFPAYLDARIAAVRTALHHHTPRLTLARLR